SCASLLCSGRSTGTGIARSASRDGPAYAAGRRAPPDELLEPGRGLSAAVHGVVVGSMRSNAYGIRTHHLTGRVGLEKTPPAEVCPDPSLEIGVDLRAVDAPRFPPAARSRWRPRGRGWGRLPSARAGVPGAERRRELEGRS